MILFQELGHNLKSIDKLEPFIIKETVSSPTISILDKIILDQWCKKQKEENIVVDG